MNRILYLFSLFAICFTLSAESLKLETVKKIIDTNHSELKTGIISNLSVSPFDKNLVSFELEVEEFVARKKREVIKLFLLNVKNKKLFEIESKKYNPPTKMVFTKNLDLKWHPTREAFVFHNKKFMYYCEVKNSKLINQFAVKGYRINIKESDDVRNSWYREPSFNYNGNEIYFLRRETLKDKKKYNRSFNICKVSSFMENIDSKNFDDLEFEVVKNGKFDQVNPIAFKFKDIELLAYNSMKNRMTKKNKDDFYYKYSINLMNINSGDNYKIADCEGYKTYNFYPSIDKDKFFYLSPLPILETPQEQIDAKINILNLRGVRLQSRQGKLKVSYLKNEDGEDLFEDVSPKGLAFLGNNHLIVPAYQDGLRLFLLNLDKWLANEEDPYSEIVFKNEAYFPSIDHKRLFLVYYEKIRGGYVDFISSFKYKADLAKPKKEDEQQIADIGKSETVEDVYEEEYKEEEFSFYSAKDDENEKEIIRLITSLNLAISSLAKVNNKMSNLLQEINDEKDKLAAFDSKSRELSRQKSSLIIEIAQLQDKKVISVEKLNELAAKREELSKLNNDLALIDKQIEENKKSLRDENERLKNSQAEMIKFNEVKNQVIASLNDLKLERSKTQDKENQIFELEKMITEYTENIKSVDKNIDLNQKDILSLKSSITDNEKLLDKYNQNLKELNAEIQNLQLEQYAGQDDRKKEFVKGIYEILKGNELTSLEIFDKLDVQIRNSKEIKLVSDLLSEHAEYFKGNDGKYYYRLKGSTENEQSSVSESSSQETSTKDEYVEEEEYVDEEVVSSSSEEEYVDEEVSSEEEYFDADDVLINDSNDNESGSGETLIRRRR